MKRRAVYNVVVESLLFRKATIMTRIGIVGVGFMGMIQY